MRVDSRRLTGNTPFGGPDIVRYRYGMKTRTLIRKDLWYGLLAFAVTMAVLQAFDSVLR